MGDVSRVRNVCCQMIHFCDLCRLSYLQGARSNRAARSGRADACTADAVYEDEMGPLLKEILAWRIPDGLKGWWGLVGQTGDPAGGACLQTLKGHSTG